MQITMHKTLSLHFNTGGLINTQKHTHVVLLCVLNGEIREQ